jgi:hypothetical protein
MSARAKSRKAQSATKERFGPSTPQSATKERFGPSTGPNEESGPEVDR